MDEQEQVLFSYWDTFESLIASGSGPVQAVAPTKLTWVAHDVGFEGASLNVALVPSRHEIRVELFMDGDHAHALFDRLHRQRDEIETQIGSTLIWEQKVGVRRRKTYVKNDGLDLNATSNWRNQHSWIADMLNRFHITFNPLLSRIDLTSLQKGDR
ncbi:DUF4268 domain-containing protein [Marinovum sp.]|uniref:DUF4268 domain-containing protein n=1 Tax=Marinovum sp. TaxID=2024839 RepID=UPI002B26E400|nr:DUF4268 domain-containing protein [Marinovum sp.]